MSLFDIGNAVLERYTGLPSKSTFLREHVVPAKDDDKFNNNKCVQCWDEYTDEHPGVKISPCGHIFGRDCLYEIVNGPTGDLCPYCRSKLFRRTSTKQDIFMALSNMLTQAIFSYCWIVSRFSRVVHASIAGQTACHPQLRPFIVLLFDGLALQGERFVRHRTGVCTRNPNLRVAELFCHTTVLSHLLLIGFPFIAPALLPVYFMFSTAVFKVSFVAANLAFVAYSQALFSGYFHFHAGMFEGDFENDSDRALVTYVAAVAVAFQQLCIIILIWPVPTMRFARTSLASVAWR
ncbi:uncharacterized protein M421DRAFT_9492 [Didymella exigua CBS 183.55]|uniref:RING-type domain-containing protein n=1 Tax=Didymella exigua CBS 183.55 TaxID=1150837 RepID=A0A6A5R6F4_9PLEO|nr:uncharacterized protein M421DRAFT_9492 [Didymella exigua CBS 183.55]KAF1923705.1 hypothetical protein M421DRAFT_9492 [Didymella exigua CBS 183.55]